MEVLGKYYCSWIRICDNNNVNVNKKKNRIKGGSVT
jgi:hypothetical protein